MIRIGNHDNMPTYCKRPVNFTEILIKRWQEVVKPEDLVIHLGDVAIGNRRHVKDILAELPGRKVLVLGNHDKQHGPDWWMDQGFAFACEAMKYRGCWLTHAPSPVLPMGCRLNIHGHLHNFTSEVHPDYHAEPFQRLFAVEYTDYRPVNFDKFVAQPDRYKARIHHKSSRFSYVYAGIDNTLVHKIDNERPTGKLSPQRRDAMFKRVDELMSRGIEFDLGQDTNHGHDKSTGYCDWCGDSKPECHCGRQGTEQ